MSESDTPAKVGSMEGLGVTAPTRADPACKFCHGTGIDGDVQGDGSVGDVDCTCLFREQAQPYCRECGHDVLRYLEQYANGCEYKCTRCATVQMW